MIKLEVAEIFMNSVSNKNLNRTIKLLLAFNSAFLQLNLVSTFSWDNTRYLKGDLKIKLESPKTMFEGKQSKLHGQEGLRSL